MASLGGEGTSRWCRPKPVAPAPAADAQSDNAKRLRTGAADRQPGCIERLPGQIFRRLLMRAWRGLQLAKFIAEEARVAATEESAGSRARAGAACQRGRTIGAAVPKAAAEAKAAEEDRIVAEKAKQARTAASRRRRTATPCD